MSSILLLLCVLMSHGAAVAEFVRAIREHRLPSTLEFGFVSFVLYYDLGIALEAFGLPYLGDFFKPFSQYPEPVQLQVALIIIFAPWVMKFGYTLAGKDRKAVPVVSALRRDRAKQFYFLSFLVLSAIALASGIAVAVLGEVWEARYVVGSVLGPYIIFLSLPLYLLAFYVVQRDSRTPHGRIALAGFVILNTIAVIPIGERTLVLLPLVIVLLFYGRLTSLRLGVALLAGIAAAVLLLPFYKSQRSGDRKPGELIGATVSNDFARAQTLADALQRSPLMGTNIMRYPGEGYVYSALFFIPRSVVPFKGDGTAFYYTAAVTNAQTRELDWGLGISAIDEIVLNFGKLFVVPGLLFWGFLMKWADRVSTSHTVLVIPTRLAAIWFLGYHLPAELQGFGAMAVVGILFHKTFCMRIEGHKRVAVMTNI